MDIKIDIFSSLPFVNFVRNNHDFIKDQDPIRVPRKSESNLGQDLQIRVVERQNGCVRKQP